MDRCDACTCPYPKGDSSSRRMAIEARELGFDGLVTLGDVPADLSGITVLRGAVVRAENPREVLRQVRRLSGAGDLVMVRARDVRFNRAVVTQPGIHILCELHRIPRGGFDHVTARAAAERGVAVDLSIRPIIRYRGLGRQRVLDRYADILRLHRRFGFPLTLSSSAMSVLELRSPRQWHQLAPLFGMEKDEVDAAMKAVGTLVDPPRPVEVVE